jgi:hypothetical protein
VNGVYEQIQFNDGYDCVKVMNLAQWGGNTWMSMHRAFSGCVNMTISASDGATAVTGTVEDFKKAWFGCRGLTNFPLLNTAAATEFNEAWKSCAGLTSFSLLNTAAGTNFEGAWKACAGLTSFPTLNTAAGTNFNSAWEDCRGLKNFPLLNFGKMETAERCFSCVTLTSASYGELLSSIAALNKIRNIEFDGGFSKAQGLIGIQAREKLIKKLGWTIYDGDHLKPAPQDAPPAEPQPKPEAANDF